MANKAKKVMPERPDEKNAEKYWDQWQEAGYDIIDNAIRSAFLEVNNTDIKIVRARVTLVNSLYHTHISDIEKVSKHIVEKAINEGLDSKIMSSEECKNKEAVELISNVQKLHLPRNVVSIYSFATKYCSFHNPTKFPIYDSNVEWVLKYYRKNGPLEFKKVEDLKNYSIFKKVIDDFMEYYGWDSKYKYKKIDEYLWELGR
jgi:hypothetical protein